jgi:molybdopterin converting factor small subunit
MAVSFVIPGPLREFAGNRSDITLDAADGTVRDAIERLCAECPGIRDRVLTETGDVRPHVNIFVDGQNARYLGGLAAPVRDGAEVMLMPAISGG